MAAEVDDPERAPRSLTLHYLRPPVAGDGAGRRDGRARRPHADHGHRPPVQDGRAMRAGARRLRRRLRPRASTTPADAARGAARPRTSSAAPPAPGVPEDRRSVRDATGVRRAAVAGAEELGHGRLAAVRRAAAPLDAPALAMYCRRLAAFAVRRASRARCGADDRPHDPLPRAGCRSGHGAGAGARRLPLVDAARRVLRGGRRAGRRDGVLLAQSRQLALLLDGGR